MIIFGGVPISVFIPPKIDANARGIRNFPACNPSFWQVDREIGSRSAIAPILLMNDERMAALNIIRNKNCVSLGENLPIKFPVTADRPASWRPLLISNTNATVITAGWENPNQEHLVTINELGASSIDVGIICYSDVCGFSDFKKIKHRLIKNIIKIVESNNSEFAYPTSSIFVESLPKNSEWSINFVHCNYWAFSFFYFR